jgi:uncharacterized membrane protein
MTLLDRLNSANGVAISHGHDDELVNDVRACGATPYWIAGLNKVGLNPFLKLPSFHG